MSERPSAISARITEVAEEGGRSVSEGARCGDHASDKVDPDSWEGGREGAS